MEWDIYTDQLDLKGFKANVHNEFVDFFTQKEREIIGLLVKGHTSKEIAQAIFVSPYTVATHRKNILRKCRCHSVRELIDFCWQNGII